MTLLERAKRGRSEPLRIWPPSFSNSSRKSCAQVSSSWDGLKPSLMVAVCSGSRHSLPVKPNSDEIEAPCVSTFPAVPWVGPSIGEGSMAALDAMVNWLRAYARALGEPPNPVSRRKSPTPKASRKVPRAAAIELMRCSPRRVLFRSTIGTPGRRAAVSLTWSVDSTIASMTPSSPPFWCGPSSWWVMNFASSLTSCSHHWVAKPLMRTQPVWPAANQSVTFLSARSLSFGATASSMSNTTTSAAESSADWNPSGCTALTRSQDRARSAWTFWPGEGVMYVVMMELLGTKNSSWHCANASMLRLMRCNQRYKGRLQEYRDWQITPTNQAAGVVHGVGHKTSALHQSRA